MLWLLLSGHFVGHFVGHFFGQFNFVKKEKFLVEKSEKKDIFSGVGRKWGDFLEEKKWGNVLMFSMR